MKVRSKGMKNNLVNVKKYSSNLIVTLFNVLLVVLCLSFVDAISLKFDEFAKVEPFGVANFLIDRVGSAYITTIAILLVFLWIIIVSNKSIRLVD